MARKYTIRSKEEKLAVVKRNLAGEVFAASPLQSKKVGCRFSAAPA